jgi:dienelactone hydrolase
LKRHGLVVLLIALGAIAAALAAYRRYDYRPRFARTAGELVAVRDSTGIGWARDGKRLTEVTLVGDTGLTVRARVRAEGGPGGARFPAAILLGGYKTGRKSVDIPADTGNLVLLSIEYPYTGPEKPRGFDWVRYFGTMRRAVVDTPAAILLAAQYLYTREDVDPSRVTIIGVSLGVPFSVAAAATDKRIAGAALLHGGGDIATMARYAFADKGPAWVMRGLAWGLAWVVAPLEPTRYAGEVAPRPVLMVNAAGDEFIPRSSVLDLYDALRQPKRIVWIETAHVATSDEAVVEQLMAITLDWMAERGLR